MKRRKFLQALGAIGVGIPLAKHIKPEEEVICHPSRLHMADEPGKIIGHHPEIIISDFELVPGGLYIDENHVQYYAITKSELYNMYDDCIQTEWPNKLMHVSSAFIEPANRGPRYNHIKL